jgi:hypothetical protein
VLLAAALAVPASARAQADAAQRAQATRLFNEGKALMNDGQTAEACARLEESQRLDPAPGTLLNLAFCHERLGKTATAWAEYGDARAAAQKNGRDDRVTFADAHARALEPRLSRLTITVAPGADLPGLVIRRDGGVVPRAAWGTPLPIDPGPHQVEASASGYLSVRIDVQVGPDGDLASAVLTPLAAAPPPATPATRAPADAPTAGGGDGATAAAGPRADGGGRARQRAAIVVGAGGLVTTWIAGYLGLRAIDLREQGDQWCPLGTCTARATALYASARRDADLSTAGFVVGLTGMAIAGYLALSARHAPGGAATTTTMTPATGALLIVPGDGGGSLQLVGAF